MFWTSKLQNVLRTRTGKISPLFSSFFFHISHLAQTTQLQLEKILFGIAPGLAFFISVPRESGEFWHSTLRHSMPRRFLKANKNTAPSQLDLQFFQAVETFKENGFKREKRPKFEVSAEPS